jgi:hypothetical protein
MYRPIPFSTATPTVPNLSSKLPLPLRLGFLLIAFALALALFALSPTARAVSPRPDGGFPGRNTAEGSRALFSLTSGFENMAIGSAALLSNTVGSFNTASGANALFTNTSGVANTATGDGALFSNTTGSDNTATGFETLASNTTGFFNTATGLGALESNTTASNNTANGYFALASNTTGKNNIALGFNAGANLTTGNDNIDIGHVGGAGESGHIHIGTQGTQTRTLIAGIYGATVASGVGVVVSSNGQLGTVTSSARFKEAIKPMDKASEAILALTPVTFRYKEKLDPDRIPQFGLIAEEVEKINPDLVMRDEEGKVSSVRYEAVNAMLLNEFLKEHRKVEEQGAIIATQEKQIEALTAGLQQVGAQMELSKGVVPVAISNR